MTPDDKTKIEKLMERIEQLDETGQQMVDMTVSTITLYKTQKEAADELKKSDSQGSGETA